MSHFVSGREAADAPGGERRHERAGRAARSSRGDAAMSKLTNSRAWRALEAHAQDMAGRHLRDLFAADAGRFEAFTLRLDETNSRESFQTEERGNFNGLQTAQ